MIQLSREKIFFSLPEVSILREGDPRKRPLAKDLVCGHVCPNCGVVAQAMYRTDRRLKDLTKEYFQLEQDWGASKFAVSTPKHEVSPRYHSYLLQGGQDFAELIRESYHFHLNTTAHAGKCAYSRAVFTTGRFNLIFYLFATAQIVMSREWFGGSLDYWNKLRDGLLGPDPERNNAHAAQLFEELKNRIKVAEDVTGNGAPLWLLSKGDWGYYNFSTAISNLPKSTNKKEDTL